jgi:flagellar assembly protein FliH
MERVLKAGKGAESWPRRRISAAEWMGAERAQALVASAEAEAEAVRGAADRDRAAALEAAREEGRRLGLASAAAKLAAAETARARWLERAEPELVELALEVARTLLARELRLDPAAIREAAAAALDAARGHRQVRLRLHPEGAEALRHEAGALAHLAALPSVEVTADATLEPGDLVVEAEAGLVDGRLDCRLESFRRALVAEAA